MVGTLDFFVSFIISLITAQRWAGFTAVKLTGKLFHVWTLCSDAALSTCLFTLLLNTYLFHEKTLNTRADKDEKRRQFFFFSFSLCVKPRATYFQFHWIEERQRWLEMRQSMLHGLSLNNSTPHSWPGALWEFGESIDQSAQPSKVGHFKANSKVIMTFAGFYAA